MPKPRITLLVTARNDDYGGTFLRRLQRCLHHNVAVLRNLRVSFEVILVEWNPPEQPPLLSELLIPQYPELSALVVPPSIHDAYTLNPHMPFHEMAAKNACIRRARGDWILVTNADIAVSEGLAATIAERDLDPRTIYRAHRIDIAESQLDSWVNAGLSPQEDAGKPRHPFYLGGAGDFLLASRELWHRLRGLNDVIRWTTRAKDWQFLLSAAVRGFPVEFLGTVYHLEHSGGFRGTPPEFRDTSTAHFGGVWDFEFGLPVNNREAWGLARCREIPGPHERTAILEPPPQLFTPEEEKEDRRWQQWLSPPPDLTDPVTPPLFYAILHCFETGRPLILRPRQPRSAVAAAGLARVALAHGVSISWDWRWEPCSWLTLPELPPAPPKPPGDAFVAEEVRGSWVMLAADGLPTASLLPERHPPRRPKFNRFLARRLLRAFLRCREQGYRRLAIFGAGGHTRELLAWGRPDWLEYVAVLSSTPAKSPCRELGVFQPTDLDYAAVDAILLSSASYEVEMLGMLEALQVDVPVLPLYADWPPGL